MGQQNSAHDHARSNPGGKDRYPFDRLALGAAWIDVESQSDEAD